MTFVIRLHVAGKSYAFRIPGSLWNILRYIGDGHVFFDEVHNKWRVVDGKNNIGRFDEGLAGTVRTTRILLAIGVDNKNTKWIVA